MLGRRQTGMGVEKGKIISTDSQSGTKIMVNCK